MRDFLRRRRASVASGTALAVAAGAVVVYAATAEGYRSHQTELNDGGIWVTTSDRGYFGRVNKPVGQLDGALYYQPDTVLDVRQDGAAVVGIDRRSKRAVALDPATLTVVEEGAVAVADPGEVEMRGGTLAAVAPQDGRLWATRHDPRTGSPAVGAVDQQGEPLAEVGGAASLAVSVTGRVLAVSGDREQLTVLAPDEFDFTEPRTVALDPAAGTPTDVTAVGGIPVTLDSAAGRLAVVDGPAVRVDGGGVLQEAGPEAATVLVATSESLLEVDLADGRVSTLVQGVSGRPTPPVRLGACVYGAWSGGGYVAVTCGSDEPTVTRLEGGVTDLVFRVNRGEILLNDQRSGSVWDLDSDNPLKIDNWEVFTDTRQVKQEEQDDQQQSRGDRRRPQAEPDRFGARPGRTSVLYPLDNDTAPEGRLLAIRAVDQPAAPGSRVTISPDRQTLQLTLPAQVSGPVSFDYQIDDGRDLNARATVTVDVRGPAANTEPRIREGTEPRIWRVPAGGSVEIPVLPDWRDYDDSDPLQLATVGLAGAADRGASARATNHGRIRFTAPAEGGTFDVDYGVGDGIAPPVTERLRVEVQDPMDVESYPPSAEADVVSGQVGEPILVRPLANDLPGSDPTVPDAELALAGEVLSRPGLDVTTDTVRGLVRVEAERPGTYLLEYDAAYGNAPLAEGRIRVDVQPKPARVLDPVVVPDTLTLHGQSAASVDVLANDVDPAGGILVVQGARPDHPDQLDVSVVEGRWLRISPRQAELSPRSQVVRYTVSNGARSGVTGEVVVTQQPRPADNTPVPAPDNAVVRAGAVVAHPVLDNDFSPSGDRLSLATDVLPQTPGRLEVERPQGVGGDVGQAYVAGRTVRYVAPTDVAERTIVTIPHVVVNSTGDSAQGRLTVTVVPADEENSAPMPPTLEGRMVAGDTLSLDLPTSGVDPDGDPVTITGISSAPTLGRVMEYGASSLSFQAFPGAVGTEEFSYTVTDTRGAEATATVRVAVVPPTPPQPPVAVTDSLTVAPGATARIDVLANDQVAAADAVRVSLVDPPDGVELESDQGPLLVPTPDDPDAPQVDVVYSISNGLSTSTAVASVLTAEGHNNPPVVPDAFGRADDSDAVTVDLLAGGEDRRAAYDLDGPADELRVTEVLTDPEIYSLDGDTITVQRGEDPRVVPFTVSDADGGVTTASLHVPATGNGRPYLRSGAMLELAPGDGSTVDVSDFVVDPAGREVMLNGRNRVWAAPGSELAAQGSGPGRVELSSRSDYTGPAALVVEVVTEQDPDDPDGPDGPDGADTADTADGPDGSDTADGTDTADSEEGENQEAAPTLVTIPVQVGTDRPTLQCPDDPLQVSQAGSLEIDIASLCFVWTLDPDERFSLDYTAELQSPVTGVGVGATDGSRFRLDAAGATRAGSEAVVVVRAGDSEPETIRVQVTRAAPPSLLPIQVADMRPGSSRSIDLAAYLRAGVASPTPRILDVSRISGSSVNATPSGSVLQLSAPRNADGRTELRIEMTDVSGDPGPERRVTTRVSIEVLDVPTVPGQPFAEDVQDNAMRLSWRPSAPRGAPIDHYEVREVNTGARQRFRTNAGSFPVKVDGSRYSFVVRAHNKVGYSEWSRRSFEGVADTRPGRVPWLRMAGRGDGYITLTWAEPRTESSPITEYHLAWPGGGRQVVRGDQRQVTIEGLDNNRQYTFVIFARNEAGRSVRPDTTSDALQPVGTPPAPRGVRATDLQSGIDSTTVEVAWNRTLAEGPGPTTYTVTARSGNTSLRLPGCVRTESTTCRHTAVPYDGRVWNYTVTASNRPGRTSPTSTPASFEAVGTPDPWGTWTVQPTGNNREVAVDFTVPVSRGASSRVTIFVDGEARVNREMRGPRRETLRLSTNERTHDISLRLCNELGAPQGCRSTNVQKVQSYGPLNGSLEPVSGTATAPRTIEWTISGTSNGRPARLEVTVEGGQPTFYDVPGTGGFSRTVTTTTPGFEERQRINVRLFDPQVARGSAERSAQATSGVAPPPGVTLSIDRCTDDPHDTLPSCGRRGTIWPGKCTGPTCGYLVIATNDMNHQYRCQIQKSGPGGNETQWRVFDGNGRHRTELVYDRGRVEVTCRETQGNRPPGTAVLLWPDPPPDPPGPPDPPEQGDANRPGTDRPAPTRDSATRDSATRDSATRDKGTR